MEPLNLHNLVPQTKWSNRLKHVADITHSYWAHDQVISMAQNNPPQHCAADPDPPRDPDQDSDVTMANTAGDSAPHGGQDLDDHLDQKPMQTRH